MRNTLRAGWLVIAFAVLPLPLIATSVQAASIAVAAAGDADQLADALLQKIGGEGLVVALVGQTGPMVINQFVTSGVPKEQAQQIWERYMKPEFEAEAPQLLAKLHAILVEDFTVAELDAIVSNKQNDARRSAAAKVPHMQEQFAAAGTEWGQQVAQTAYAAHKDEIDALGRGAQ